MRLGLSMRRWQDVLGAALAPAPRAVLRVMLGFPAWRSLAHDSGLDADAADPFPPRRDLL